MTAEISKATFGMIPSEYKKITRNKDVKGFDESKKAAKEGGEVAGNARKDAERRIGKPINSGENYLSEPEKKKNLEDKNKK